MTLRDAVRTATNTISSAARQLGEVAADPSRPLAERRAAFRKLSELEVGATWCRPARSLVRDFDLPEVYLKFEGENPSGTQKDRIAFAQVADALAGGQAAIALATCGNYGVAVALAARLAGLRCHVFIPAGYHTHRLREMSALGAVLERPAGSYEDVVRLSSERAAANGWYDANPGGKNAELQIKAYAAIGREIAQQVAVPIVHCAVPVSNGTLLAGIHHGLREAGPVALVAASSTAKNPIVYSFNRGLQHCVDLDPAKIKETVINEPLINWHSFDGQEALDALRASGGLAYNISDARLRRTADYLAERESLRVLPAATAGLAALLRMHEEGVLPDGPHVAVLTAKP